MKRKTKWVLKRHTFYRTVARFLLRIYFKLFWNIKFEGKLDKKQQYFILMNHQNNLDPLLVMTLYKGKCYPVGTDEVVSVGFGGMMLRHCFNPIPIKKFSNDLKSIMSMKQCISEGGTILLAPEGNRTYSGTTQTLFGNMGKLAKMFKIPVAIINIEGGYRAFPRWAKSKRKATITCKVREIIDVDYIKNTDSEILNAQIEKALYMDDNQIKEPVKGKDIAEYLERVAYVCPKCGLSTFESHHDEITCKNCGVSARMDNDYSLSWNDSNINLPDFKKWYDYQEKYIDELDINSLGDAPLYEETVNIYLKDQKKGKSLLYKNVLLKLFSNRGIIDNIKEVDFDHIDYVSIALAHKLDLSIDGKTYQIIGDERFNAVKYMHLYYKYKNSKKGDNNGRFYGL